MISEYYVSDELISSETFLLKKKGGDIIDALNSSAISIGLLSGVWFILSTKLGVMTWVGFMGCTSYYAAGNRFFKGWRKSVICNMSGIFWAMIAITVSNVLPIPEPVAVMTTIV